MSSPALSSPNQRPISHGLLGLLTFLMAVGLLSFVGGLFSDPETTWRAFHVNFIYWATLSQSGVVFAAALVIVGARWSGPLRHIAEGLSAWVPISFVLCMVGYFGREYVFEPWIHGAPPGKESWLSIGRVYTMDLSILGVLTVLTWMFLKASVRPALKDFSERAVAAKGLFEIWAGNWRGDEEEAKASEKRLKVLAPIIALTYVFGYTIIGYDQVMSLDPTWFSTMYGWYFCWGGWLSAIAARGYRKTHTKLARLLDFLDDEPIIRVSRKKENRMPRPKQLPNIDGMEEFVPTESPHDQWDLPNLREHLLIEYFLHNDFLPRTGTGDGDGAAREDRAAEEDGTSASADNWSSSEAVHDAVLESAHDQYHAKLGSFGDLWEQVLRFIVLWSW